MLSVVQGGLVCQVVIQVSHDSLVRHGIDMVVRLALVTALWPAVPHRGTTVARQPCLPLT